MLSAQRSENSIGNTSMTRVRGEMHGKNPDAVERWVRCLIADEGLKFVEKDVFEASLPMASSVFGKTSA
jgi:hypothetical protein